MYLQTKVVVLCEPRFIGHLHRRKFTTEERWSIYSNKYTSFIQCFFGIFFSALIQESKELIRIYVLSKCKNTCDPSWKYWPPLMLKISNRQDTQIIFIFVQSKNFYVALSLSKCVYDSMCLCICVWPYVVYCVFLLKHQV